MGGSNPDSDTILNSNYKEIGFGNKQLLLLERMWTQQLPLRSASKEQKKRSPVGGFQEIVRMNMCMIYHNEGRVFHHSFIATDS